MRRLLALAACLAVAGVAAQAALSAGPLDTALVATADFSGPDADLAYTRARAAGATFIRITAPWAQISAKAPAKGSNVGDPGNPAYDWTALDEAVKRARAHKLLPIVNVNGAPRWAWSHPSAPEPGEGPIQPSLAALAGFSVAAAQRYSGGTSGIPRVKYWQLWNEPNLSVYLRPQLNGDQLVSASWYRAMTNVFYKAVHSVRNDNTVIAGGLSPFTVENNDTFFAVGPLRFMREMLCMSAGERPHPTCSRKAQFDIWAHHPYTAGDSTHEALNPDDVSLGDLPEMKRLLDAAVKAGHVVSRQKVRFWVTEFSWDSQPGDPKGVPAKLHARWVSEALYRMWQNGISLVAWFNLRDDPFGPGSGFCQCGLWLHGTGGLATDKPKLSLQAFRFPFVAYTSGDGTISFWGRTQDSSPTPVVIEQRIGSSWVGLASSTPGKRGIFAGTTRARSKTAAVRARVVATDDASVPFSLVQPPDLPICAFGTC